MLSVLEVVKIEKEERYMGLRWDGKRRGIVGVRRRRNSLVSRAFGGETGGSLVKRRDLVYLTDLTRTCLIMQS